MCSTRGSTHVLPITRTKEITKNLEKMRKTKKIDEQQNHKKKPREINEWKKNCCTHANGSCSLALNVAMRQASAPTQPHTIDPRTRGGGAGGGQTCPSDDMGWPICGVTCPYFFIVFIFFFVLVFLLF